MNKELKYNTNIGYPGDAEQIKTNCLMQDVNGNSHLNSPTKFLFRIENVDKMEIVKSKITIYKSLFINDINFGSTLTSHGSSISTIQGNISTINSNISGLNNDKQNNITLVAGTNISITKNPADTLTIDSTASSLLSGTNNISVFNNSISLSSNISTDNCSLKNLSADEITSGLVRITTQTTGSSIAVFGNKN